MVQPVLQPRTLIADRAAAQSSAAALHWCCDTVRRKQLTPTLMDTQCSCAARAAITVERTGRSALAHA